MALLLIAGCASNQDLDDIERSQQKEQTKFSEPEGLEINKVEEKLEKIKKDLKKIDFNQNSAEKLVKSAEKSALDLIDECIESNKNQDLPIYECTKLLKP